MEVVTPSMETAESITDQWMSLATGQQAHGSHLLPEQNRQQVHREVARRIARDQLLVARAEQLRGFVMFSVETGKFEQDVCRGVIENLYVEPEFRSRGVGSALLEAAERALSEADVDVVTLGVLAPNERARSFYRDHGYTPHRIECEKPI